MTSMDLKGISWVGNVYQKFEAMCLEVEEIMYQDTVKYVENQVQTVGSSVKKFYSDVMQDLVPPSSFDAAKGAVSDLPLELYADVGFYTKPKISEQEKHGKVDDIDKWTEDPKMTTGINFGRPPPIQRLSRAENLFPTSERDSAGGASKHFGKKRFSNKSNLGIKKISRRESVPLNEKLETITPQDKDLACQSSFCEPRQSSICEPLNKNHLGDSDRRASNRNGKACLPNKSNVGIKKNSESESMSLNETLGVSSPLENGLTRASLSCEVSNENKKASLDRRANITTSVSVKETEHDRIEEKSKCEIQNANEQMSETPAEGGSTSDTVKVLESGMSKEIDVRCSSNNGSSLAEANAADVCINPQEVETCGNEQLQMKKIACEEDFGSCSGWIDDRLNEVETHIENELEIVQQVAKAELEGSCIVVNRDEFHFVPHIEGKSKSYKKKIQGVFSPRKRSSRKHEYEQLAKWPVGDLNSNQKVSSKISMPSLTIEDAKQSFPTPDVTESEWELL